MQVICIKFSSAEEIIAKVSAVALFDATFCNQPLPWPIPTRQFVIEDAMLLNVHPMGNGQFGISFSPWSVGNQNGTFVINPDSVTAVYPPADDLEKSYLSQMTGIAIPSFPSSAPTTRM